MEVKSDEGTVVVADRNSYSDECCNNRGCCSWSYF